MAPGKRLTLQQFKSVVEERQPGKIDLSEVKEYINTHTPVPCICKLCGYNWPAAPMHIMKKDKPTACPKCKGKGRTAKDFMELSSTKFGAGNFTLLSDFINMSTGVSMRCPLSHTFTVSPLIHLRPESLGGCKDCQAIGISIRRSYTQVQWVELARKVHDAFYKYDKAVYSGSSDPVTITCPIDGDFPQSPVSHLSGAGCPKCGIRKSAEAKVYTEEDKGIIISELMKKHEGLYKYGKIFNDSSGRLLIEVICEKHELFIQRLDHHRHGHGCQNCMINYSKQEIEWLEYCMLREGYIQHAKNRGQYKIPGTLMSADGFNEDKNTIYEFQGDYWHGNPKVHNEVEINTRTGTTFGFLYQRTKNKINLLLSKGYILREMWESDWKRGKNAIIIIQRNFRSKNANQLLLTKVSA